MFLGRTDVLKKLWKAKDELLEGKGSLYFISGIKGSGKTFLLKKFAQSINDVDVIYIDIKRLSLSIDLFCIYFIGNIFFFLAKEEGEKASYFNVRFQKKIIEELNDKEITRHLNPFYEELQKQKPDYSLLLKLAFQFPSIISKNLSIPIVLLLDEFQEISFVSNYRIDPYGLFKKATRNDGILWILASSKKNLPFENKITLSGFLPEDTENLLLNFNKGAKERLFEITEGISYPFFVLLERIGNKDKIDSFLVDEALSTEIRENGRLDNYCEQMMDNAINAARGEGLIRSCLISLARNPHQKLTAISKDIRRSTGVTKSLLSRLMETEIIERKDNAYFIPNSLLNLWINIYYYGKRLEIKDPIINLLKSFNHQKVSGEIFGMEEGIILPKFLSLNIRDDGLIEGEGEKEKWLIKVLREGIAGNKELEELKGFSEKANSLAWFISMDGFLSDVFFQKGKTMLSIGEDIKTLQEILTKKE
ncbi:MAG: ATP-binding protein [bacterium]